MSRRLQQVIAWWFVLQIVLPFTAPLQTLELRDLFGIRDHHASTSSPESTTTPTITEARSDVATVSVLTMTAVDHLLSPAGLHEASTRAVRDTARHLLPGPQVQRSVLRL
jgi:hypothetical protein